MIRDALSKDIPQLLLMCEAFWKEGAPFEEYDERHTLDKLKQYLDMFPFYVSEVDGKLNGMMILVYSDALCAPIKFAAELAWYVVPEARRGGIGIELIKNAEARAIEDGCQAISMAYMTKNMPDVVKSIYEKLGYRESERTYLKRLN